jgi:citrate synthase
MGEASYPKGLEGVVVAESTICRIDGEKGRLFYRGYPIEDLARYSSYEEVVYLLLFEKLPNAAELAAFSEGMRQSRHLVMPIREMIRTFPVDAHPMELLQSAISYLSGYVEHKIRHSATCNCRRTLHQVAQLASVVATLHRYRRNESYVTPRPDLSHGANFLYMLHGREPDEDEGSIMDACLVLHAEHEMNASTFTARVVASTISTCYCSISAAIGALYGSLHGGANEQVMAMVEEIGSPDRVEKWIDAALSEKRKVVGMGHRVYRAKDPRAVIMEGYLQRLSDKRDDHRYYDILKEIERVFRKRMEEKGKPIYPNADFFSGAVYSMLGIPSFLFTPIFAMARVAGWLANILEQREHDNRIYRPLTSYIGPEPREYVPLENR